MGIGRVIGNWISTKLEKRRRKQLEDHLGSFGLSEDEIKEVTPYIDYVAENGGGAGQMIGIVVFIIFGVLAILFGVLARLPMPIMLIPLLSGLVFIGIGAFIYRKRKKAKNVRQALLSNPETFVEGGPHPYHSIKED